MLFALKGTTLSAIRCPVGWFKLVHGWKRMGRAASGRPDGLPPSDMASTAPPSQATAARLTLPP